MIAHKAVSAMEGVSETRMPRTISTTSIDMQEEEERSLPINSVVAADVEGSTAVNTGNSDDGKTKTAVALRKRCELALAAGITALHTTDKIMSKQDTMPITTTLLTIALRAATFPV